MQYFVSPTGNDGSKGSEDAAFQTITRATRELKPGDECVLRGGTYRETLKLNASGTIEHPIVIRAYHGESPMIAASDIVDGWTDDGNGMFSAALPVDLNDRNQVFADGQMLDEARWPNSNGDLFKPVRASAKDGSPATLIDPELASIQDAVEGSMLWCAGGAKWICWAADVSDFDTESQTISFSTSQTERKFYVPCEGSEYVLMGSRNLLTGPNEWWVDHDASRISVALGNGRSPDDSLIEAKARIFAIDLRGAQHIRLDGIHFTGGGLIMDEKSRNIRLEGMTGSYVAHSFREDASEESIVINGEDHVVTQCDFGYSSGSVVRVRGRHHKLLRNRIHHGDYAGLWRGTLAVAGRRHVVAYNTVIHSGRDLVSIHGLSESLIEYNDLSYAGWLTHDLGMTYGHNTDFGGTIIRRNHVHDNMAKGLADGIYFDHCSHNVVVCENLIWNTPDQPIHLNNPGHFNLIAHNSAYHANTARKEINSFDHSHRQDLFGCRFLNNVVNAPYNMPDNADVRGNLIDKTIDNFDTSHVPHAQIVPIEGLNHGAEKATGAVAPGAFLSVAGVWEVGCDASTRPDETVEWAPSGYTFTNRVFNAAFELGTLEGWSTTGSGTASVVDGNGWGNHIVGGTHEPTGTSFHEAELAGACAIEQAVSGLPAGRRFNLSAWVRASESEAAVALVATGDGFSVESETTSTEWTRIAVEFEAPASGAAVTVRIVHRSSDSSHRARADNVGLVEAM